MKILPEVPAVSVAEAAGMVKAPFRFRMPAPPDMMICFVPAAEAVNEASIGI